MRSFKRISQLPPYVFQIVTDMKTEARHRGEDIIDFGMGNPDQPTPTLIVEKAISALQHGKNHRYSVSRGIIRLRTAITDWYKRRYDVDLNPENEAVVTIGSKEGIAHLALAVIDPGDIVLVPNPTYPIHPYSVIIAGGEVCHVPFVEGRDFFEDLIAAAQQRHPKMMILNFPHNPTTQVVHLDFFKKVVAFAREYDIMVVHDLAYADLVFEGYRAPSLLEVSGAKEVGVEFFTLSKSYNMPGWRVGFCVGNAEIIGALTRLKSYLDYGIFQPLQVASIIALNSPQEEVRSIAETYRHRRDVLVDGLNRIGWQVERPKATMFVWARIPEPYRKEGSLEFSKRLLAEAKVAVSPGIGFGEHGDGFVRFALVENEHRTRQALHGIQSLL